MPVSPAGDLDYVGDSIVLEQNAEWPTPDADYTPYTNVISAVWPKLRHRNYTYAVIRLTGGWDDTHWENTNHISTNDPCNYANVLVCGETSKYTSENIRNKTQNKRKSSLIS